MKAFPLRLDDAIRQAVAAHLDQRRADPVFRRRLTAAMERKRELCEGLLEVRPGCQMLVSSAGTTSGSGIGAAS